MFRRISVALTILLIAGLMALGSGGIRLPTLLAAPASVPAYSASSTLPLTCSGPTSPAPCAYGYVYYGETPVSGASVKIDSLFGSVTITTTSGGLSASPYFQTSLGGAPLLASAGGTITLTATYNGSSNSVAYEVAPNGQQVDVVIAASALFGTGASGSITVTGTSYTDNIRSALAMTATIGQSNVSVASSVGFAVGQEVLIYQTTGTGASNYEFRSLTGVSTGLLSFTQPLANTYAQAGSAKSQAMVVPQYINVLVQSGGSLTAHAWDGSTGGLLALRASGTLTVAVGGNINIDGSGFRGGVNVGDFANSQQGESVLGLGSFSRLANGGGGGGGGSVSGGGPGGGGGYGTSGQSGSCVSSNCGAGGLTYGVADLAQINLGAGGGGMSSPNSPVQGGGNGGGALILMARQFVVLGQVSASGSGGGNQSGAGYGAGGGAGGAIQVTADQASVGGSLVTAVGGPGGPNIQFPGGNGGDGRIHLTYGSLAGTTNPVAITQPLTAASLPIPTINTIYPATAIQGQDVVNFRGSAGSPNLPAATIISYSWRSDIDNVLSADASFTKTAASLSIGTHAIYFKARDSNNVWSEEISRTLTILPPDTSTPTSTATSTETSTPTKTSTSTATSSQTQTSTSTATATATATATSSQTHTSTSSSTATSTASKTSTQTPTPTATRTATPTLATPGPVGELFLPMIVRSFGDTEIEPNNALLAANGPLQSGLDYHGYQNDDRDYFKFYSTGGSISVHLTNTSAPDTQLSLYYQDINSRVAHDGHVGSPPYHLDHTGPAGWYYVRILNGAPFNSATPYTLRVTYP